MSLIDGIGDEVTEFFLIVTIICIGLAAWWSTAINHRLRIRTVLIVEHRSPANQQTTSSPVTASASDQINNNNTILLPTGTSESVRNDSHENRETVASDQEQQAIVQRMDADTSTVRQRRLAYFQENATSSSNVNSTVEPAVESTSSTSSEHTESKSGDVTTDTVVETVPTQTSSPKSSNTEETTKNEECVAADDGDLIRIKLKYLNDDIKSVEGKKYEKLGDFKRRHFEVELAACKLVRLIFNGQVLQKDSETLQDCGLFDNCVVHCLIHQRPQGSSQSSVNNDSTSSTSNNYHNRNIFAENSSAYMHSTATNSNTNSPGGNGERENATLPWDLGNVLLALISLILCGAWYFRFEYAQLFTVTATVFLMCLTGIFTLLLIGLLYPDPSGVQSSSGTTSATTATTT